MNRAEFITVVIAAFIVVPAYLLASRLLDSYERRLNERIRKTFQEKGWPK